MHDPLGKSGFRKNSMFRVGPKFYHFTNPVCLGHAPSNCNEKMNHIFYTITTTDFVFVFVKDALMGTLPNGLSDNVTTDL